MSFMYCGVLTTFCRYTFLWLCVTSAVIMSIKKWESACMLLLLLLLHCQVCTLGSVEGIYLFLLCIHLRPFVFMGVTEQNQRVICLFSASRCGLKHPHSLASSMVGLTLHAHSITLLSQLTHSLSHFSVPFVVLFIFSSLSLQLACFFLLAFHA